MPDTESPQLAQDSRSGAELAKLLDVATEFACDHLEGRPPVDILLIVAAVQQVTAHALNMPQAGMEATLRSMGEMWRRCLDSDKESPTEPTTIIRP